MTDGLTHFDSDQLKQIKQRSFSGVDQLYGNQAVDFFATQHVIIIGVGGVGSWAAEALARSGIGHITLLDLDHISWSNINRQIHAQSDTVGMSKIEALKQRIQLINHQCNVTTVDDFLTVENIPSYINDQYDFIIDCIDSAKVKAALALHCRFNKLKLILTGGAGGRVLPHMIETTDLIYSHHDPLLAKVKKQLRQFYKINLNRHGRFELPCVYSKEQVIYPEGGRRGGLNCHHGLGSSVVVTASFGLNAAAFVLNKLIKEHTAKRQ